MSGAAIKRFSAAVRHSFIAGHAVILRLLRHGNNMTPNELAQGILLAGMYFSAGLLAVSLVYVALILIRDAVGAAFNAILDFLFVK